MSIFNPADLPFRTRVSLLEERVSSYDEISKQMLSKLEQAVEKISESNRNISQILIRHEERIDRASENNAAIVQLLDKTEREFKDKMERSEKEIREQVEQNSLGIKDLNKSKWIWIGVIAGVSFIFSQLKVLDNISIPHPPSFRVESIRYL